MARPVNECLVQKSGNSHFFDTQRGRSRRNDLIMYMSDLFKKTHIWLHNPHAHLHEQRYDDHQRRDDETMDHGPDAGLLHAGEGGVQADGG